MVKLLSFLLALLGFKVAFALPVPTSVLPLGFMFKPYVGFGLVHYDNGDSQSSNFLSSIPIQNTNLQLGLRLHRNFGFQVEHFQTKKTSSDNKEMKIRNITTRAILYYPILKVLGTGFELLGGAGYSNLNIRELNNTKNHYIPEVFGGAQFMLLGKVSFSAMVNYSTKTPEKFSKRPLSYIASFHYYFL